MRKRYKFAVAALVSLLAVLAVGGAAELWGGLSVDAPRSNADQPVAFTTTAEELGKEYARDKRAFREKYSGKRVEVSGVVVLPRPYLKVADIMVAGDPESEILFGGRIVVTPRRGDQPRYENMRALSRGQTITARGTVARFGIMVEDAEVVTVGPSPVVQMTVAELLTALDGGGDAKYRNREVAVRAAVKDTRHTSRNGFAEISVTDPDARDGPVATVITTDEDESLAMAWAALPPGSAVVVIGQPASLPGNARGLRDARVLKAMPEGVAGTPAN